MADTFGAGANDTSNYGVTRTDTVVSDTGAAWRSSAEPSPSTTPTRRSRRTADTWAQADTAVSSWNQQPDTTNTWAQQNQQPDTTSAWAQQNQQADTSTWAQQNQQRDTSALNQPYQPQDTSALAVEDTTTGDSGAALRSALTNQTTVDSTRPVTADSIAVSGDTSGMAQAQAQPQPQPQYGDTTRAVPQHADPNVRANAWQAGQDTMRIHAGAEPALDADSLRRLGWIRASECSCAQGRQDTTGSAWRGADTSAAQGYQQQNYQQPGNPQPQDTSRTGMGAVGMMGDSAELAAELITLTSANLAALLDEANVADSSAGAFAAERATDDEVKRYAKMMMSEHGALRQDGRALLQRLGLIAEPPANDRVQAMSQQGMATLQSTPAGKQFDQVYIDQEVKMHRAVLQIARHGQHSSRDMAQIQPLIEKAIPILERHLDRAKELQEKVGKPEGSDSSDDSGN